MQLVCSGLTCGPDECVELTNRELSVCDAICSSVEPISFTQLKRSTELHQEVVSRVIRRLTTHGLVRKVEGKYEGRCFRQP